jgi:hypothetical protein
MTTELEAKQKTEIEVAHKWMRRHSADFDPNPENSKKITDFIEAHGLAERESNLEANLETAFVALTRQGVKFTTAAAPAAPSTPAAPAEDQLPQVPDYMAHIKTKHDIAQIPRDAYKTWYHGKHGHLFRARVTEILRRGK